LTRVRHRLLAVPLALCCMAPGVAAAQDQCRTIRAITNADGRRFADLSVRVLLDPPRLHVAAGRAVPLPAPRDCSFTVHPDDTDLTCSWVPGTPAASAELFDVLLARLRRCLDNRVGPVTGPQPYGNARALRDSTTTFATEGGETRLSLLLIESPATPELAAYHYVALSVGYEAAEPMRATEEE
jgi:hypothetical protein